MRSVVVAIYVLVFSTAVVNAQFGAFGPRFAPYRRTYYYPRFGFGGSRFGPPWGAGRGMAFLGAGALLRFGNPLGRAVGGLGL